jgi:hypothetical protein
MDRRWNVLALSILLLAATALRIWDFPGRYEERGVDEIQYTQGSLELLEGITPAYKYAPAGTETWLGWGYAGSLAARYLLLPTAEEKAVPFQVRPFVAVNHALFDLYRDLSGIRRFIVIVSVLLSVIAVAAAFAVGARAAGIAGGVLLGGLFAAAPLMMTYAEQARSFSIAWSFAIIAMYFAVCRLGRTARWGSAIFMGLAISQRIDMLGLVPLLWLELWYAIREKEPARTFRQSIGEFAKSGMITLVVTLLVAPWLMTNLIGNLRTIVTVRFSPPSTPVPISAALMEFFWTQGLGVIAVLFVAGTVFGLVTRQLRKPLVCLYALLLLPTVAKSDGHEIAHQTVAILAMFMAAPIAVAAISKSSWVVWSVVLASVLLPVAMAVRTIDQQKKDYVPDQATTWVESHIPSGTVVLISPSLHDPLPTPQRADAMWQEEMNNDAAAKKFQKGVERFHLGNIDAPRALSEENMIVERVRRRMWYILGSRSWIPDRRYDIHLYQGSTVFDASDPAAEFLKLGGVLIWRGTPLVGLPDPVMKWVNSDGLGTYIYCADDIRPRILP